MMKKVSEGNNPHVVNLMGCVTIQEPFCLITEFVKHGDLLTYLQTIRKLVCIVQVINALDHFIASRVSTSGVVYGEMFVCLWVWLDIQTS